MVVGAVGKWESRGVCGISKRGGKVGFLTFPPRGFSTARRAAIFSAACHVVFFSSSRQTDISWLGTDEPDTAGFARARACPVTGESTPQNRGRCERRFLRYDGSNCDAGFLPASFGVVGSQRPPFSVTQLISTLHNCRPSNTR